MAKPLTVEEEWRAYLTGRHPSMLRERRILRVLPHDPRCKLCNAPFAGVGGVLMKALGKTRSRKNPNYCNMCEVRVLKQRGGAEVELTMLFADVRGSTTLAEQMSAREFSQLMNRFYDAGLPVGAGIHTGIAFVGTVGSEETVVDFTALGDAVNITARLASLAGPGEILVSDAAAVSAGLDRTGLEHRALQLKGRSEPIDVTVLRAAAPAAVPG